MKIFVKDFRHYIAPSGGIATQLTYVDAADDGSPIHFFARFPMQISLPVALMTIENRRREISRCPRPVPTIVPGFVPTLSPES